MVDASIGSEPYYIGDVYNMRFIVTSNGVLKRILTVSMSKVLGELGQIGNKDRAILELKFNDGF